jgi:hypothetical protein
VKEPHPFIEVPDWRDGYRTFEFEYGGEKLMLLTKERDGEPPTSMVYYEGSARYKEPLPFTGALPCILNVETVVILLDLFAEQRMKGNNEGVVANQRAIRHVMGIENA